MVAKRTDPLAVDLSTNLFYASCICAEEEKYHRDYMQQFLSGFMVIAGPISYKHLIISKNYGFNNFYGCYESTTQDKASPFTLFVVENHIEARNNNEEIY